MIVDLDSTEAGYDRPNPRWAEKAARQGFSSIETYLDSLILREQQRGDWLNTLLDECGPADDDARWRRAAFASRSLGCSDEAVADGRPNP